MSRGTSDGTDAMLDGNSSIGWRRRLYKASKISSHGHICHPWICCRGRLLPFPLLAATVAVPDWRCITITEMKVGKMRCYGHLLSSDGNSWELEQESLADARVMRGSSACMKAAMVDI